MNTGNSAAKKMTENRKRVLALVLALLYVKRKQRMIHGMLSLYATSLVSSIS
jgi:hypothetical protein